jgi:hypothetical protein
VAAIKVASCMLSRNKSEKELREVIVLSLIVPLYFQLGYGRL